MSTKRSCVGHDPGSSLIRMRVICDSSEDEMIALFLLGELNSERFGKGIRSALDVASQTEALITTADLGDSDQNRARRTILGLTRGYGENRDVFENFPARVHWVRAMLAPSELARVRYIDYSYWNELSGGSRLASDAAEQIRRGIKVFGVSNERFLRAARAVERGDLFPALILGRAAKGPPDLRGRPPTADRVRRGRLPRRGRVPSWHRPDHGLLGSLNWIYV